MIIDVVVKVDNVRFNQLAETSYDLAYRDALTGVGAKVWEIMTQKNMVEIVENLDLVNDHKLFNIRVYVGDPSKSFQGQTNITETIDRTIMAFDIEKTTVTAKAHALKTRYSTEFIN